MSTILFCLIYESKAVYVRIQLIYIIIISRVESLDLVVQGGGGGGGGGGVSGGEAVDSGQMESKYEQENQIR